MKRTKAVCCGVFVLVLCLPVLQYTFGLFPRSRVQGMHTPRERGEVSIETILSSEFQTAFEKWFTRANGLWPYFVRFDNQLNFWIFRQVASSYLSQVALGKGSTLFPSFYLQEFNRTLPLPDAALEARVAKLKQLQAVLAERKIPLLLVLSANHLGVDPGILPPKFISPNRESRRGIYQRMKPMLDSAGVNYLDAMDFFRAEFEAGRRHFTPSGSHWDAVGACLITQKIIERSAELLGKKLPWLDCGATVLKDTPRQQELDLVQIANLWSASAFQLPTRYPSPKRVDQPGVFKPRILFVGTSFVLSILSNLERRKIVRSTDFFFYYRKSRHFPGGKERKLDRNSIDWQKLAQSQDLVIIECSTALMQEAGFEFVDDAIENLSKIPVFPGQKTS